MNLDLRPDIEQDEYWHQDMGALPTLEDDDFSVQEVRFGGRSVTREIIETVLLTLLIFIGVRLVIQNFVVQGTSMQPTLQDNQNLLVNKLAYAEWDSQFFAHLNPFNADDPNAPHQTGYLFGGPQRGDIVVFPAPPPDSRDFIKRVIGLPGEQVGVRADDGVYINGTKLTEPYIKDVPDYDWPGPGQVRTVPDGEIFVLGDNRRNSDDSHVFGPIPINSVVGRAWFRYWPPDQFGPLPHPTYAGP